jgi:hypothetical protein
MSNLPSGVSGCQLCMGGAGRERCCVVDVANSMRGQVNLFLNKTNHGGATMSEDQIKTTLNDLGEKIGLCQNNDEAKSALTTLIGYQQMVDSAK